MQKSKIQVKKSALPSAQFFFERVYEVVRKVPAGRVMTYGQVSDAIGTKDARRVGHALHANRDKDTPCHRVVNKDGRLAPGYAFGGPSEQRNRLVSEGVKFLDNSHVDLTNCLFSVKFN